MKKTVTIYHNPKCSKSRETLSLLRDRGIEPQVVEYLSAPPDEVRIRELIGILGGDAHALLRVKEPLAKELGLSNDSTPDEIVKAIAAHPMLFERPLVVCGNKAAIGRPPENVLSIL